MSCAYLLRHIDNKHNLIRLGDQLPINKKGMAQEWRLVLHRNPQKLANSDDLSSIWTNRSPKSLQYYLPDLPHKLIGPFINSNVQIKQLCVESLNIFRLSSLFLDLQLFFWKKLQKRPIMLKLHVCWLA